MADRETQNGVILSILAGLALLILIGGAFALERQSRKHRVRWESVTCAARPLPAGALLGPADVRDCQVPAGRLSANALRTGDEAVGQRLLVSLADGDEVHSTFFADGAEVCKDPKLLEESCARTRTRAPCTLLLKGSIAGSFDCRADYDESIHALTVTTESEALQWELEIRFGAENPPDPRRRYQLDQIEYVSLSVDGTGPEAGHPYTARHTSDPDSLAGSLAVTIAVIEKRLGRAHGSLGASAVAECVADGSCQSEDGQSSIKVLVIF